MACLKFCLVVTDLYYYIVLQRNFRVKCTKQWINLTTNAIYIIFHIELTNKQNLQVNPCQCHIKI
jgi:hypothetical protein